jgi:hypothetical protein
MHPIIAATHGQPCPKGPGSAPRHWPALLGVGEGRFLLAKLCIRWKVGLKRAGWSPETWGRECQTSQGWGQGRRGRTYYSARRWARGSRLRAPAPPPCGPAAGSPGFPLTYPGDAAGRPRWGGGAGRGHAPRRRPGGAPAPRPPGVRAPRGAAVPGDELGSGRAAPSAEPGRSALCPLPWACGRLPAFRGPAPGLARPPGRLGGPAPRIGLELGPPRPNATPRASDPGWTLLGPGSRTRAHTVQFQARDWSRALAARCCEATHQPPRRKREGDREWAGGGGGREGGEM